MQDILRITDVTRWGVDNKGIYQWAWLGMLNGIYFTGIRKYKQDKYNEYLPKKFKEYFT